jgi:GNAT superfamily N-acetyltransferase
MTSRPIARRAVIGDEEEIIRLRDLMVATLFGGDGAGDPHRDAAVAKMRQFLKQEENPVTVAFVVDAPDGAGLAASVIGSVDERVPSSKNPLGKAGYVYGVYTEERYRRRGFSRLAMQALLDWYDANGFVRLELHASEFGEGLYRELGFREPRGGAALTRYTAAS